MFAHPTIIWLLLLLPVVGILWGYARWRRRRALALLGNPFRVERLVLVSKWRRWLGQTCASLAVAALVLGLAGPQWGRERIETRTPGTDLVVVLDVSRSMLAGQPSRLEDAVRALDNLNRAYQKRGEVRLGLVLTAAYPRLQLPPSLDYSHFDFLLRRVEEGDLPPELWRRTKPKAWRLPDEAQEHAVSGTRIGAGLILAAKLKRSEAAEGFEILLVSDGDDPVDDDDWEKGVQAARAKGIPVHVLAVGEPGRPAPVPPESKGAKPMESTLNEKMLREIARRTGGSYLPGHEIPREAGRTRRPALPLAALMQDIHYTRRLKETLMPASDAALFQPQAQACWFYLAALLCLVLALTIRESRRRIQPASLAKKTRRGAAVQLLLLPAVFLMVSATPLPSVEDLVRQGNEAFAQQKYPQALELYQKAEKHALDPGLVAFNKAATLYKLERYAEATEHYQRVRDDDVASPERLGKAHYGLGTALLKQSGGVDADALGRAVDAFRECLAAETVDAVLREDARYNLELAQRLLTAALVQKKDRDRDPGGSGDKTKEGSKDGPKKDDGKKTGMDKGDKTTGKTDGVETGAVEGKDKKPAPGERLVLPDSERPAELSPLEREVERIAHERLVERRAVSRSLENAPNR